MAQTPLPDPAAYPSNTKQPAKQPVEDRPRIQKIATGEVAVAKKSVGKRIADAFTGDDARTVGDYVLMDVVVPAAKSLISDALTTAVERFFFGDGRSRTGTRGSSYGHYTNYSAISKQTGAPPWNTSAQQPAMTKRARSTHDFRELTIDNRIEAAQILDVLLEFVSMYGAVTVADYYDAMGFSSEYTDRNYGWTDLSDAEIMRTRGGGYQIIMPQPLLLK